MKSILYIGLGGGLGSIARYLFGLFLAFPNIKFPLSTFLINVVGSFIIGLSFVYFQKNNQLNSNLSLLIITGFCGGFTTFSTFSKENLTLLESGNYFLFLLYAFMSIIICILAVAFGYYLGK